jgi:hypothetical protein
MWEGPKCPEFKRVSEIAALRPLPHLVPASAAADAATPVTTQHSKDCYSAAKDARVPGSGTGAGVIESYRTVKSSVSGL